MIFLFRYGSVLVRHLSRQLILLFDFRAIPRDLEGLRTAVELFGVLLELVIIRMVLSRFGLAEKPALSRRWFFLISAFLTFWATHLNLVLHLILVLYGVQGDSDLREGVFGIYSAHLFLFLIGLIENKAVYAILGWRKEIFKLHRLMCTYY